MGVVTKRQGASEGGARLAIGGNGNEHLALVCDLGIATQTAAA